MCARNINRLPPMRPPPGTRPTTQACALTGNRTSDLLVCRMMPNPLSHTSQGKAQFFIRELEHPSWELCGSVNGMSGGVASSDTNQKAWFPLHSGTDGLHVKFTPGPGWGEQVSKQSG